MPSRTAGERQQLVHGVRGPVQAADGEQHREHVQADRVTDDPVAQQRGGDDARRELAARDLDRDQQRAEREDDERERQRDDGLEHRPRAFDPKPGDVPGHEAIEVAQHQHGDEATQHGDDRHHPECRLQVAECAVAPVPAEPWPRHPGVPGGRPDLTRAKSGSELIRGPPANRPAGCGGAQWLAPRRRGRPVNTRRTSSGSRTGSLVFVSASCSSTRDFGGIQFARRHEALLVVVDFVVAQRDARRQAACCARPPRRPSRPW